MKKVISIIITTMLVIGVLCVCTALAAEPAVDVTRGDNNTTVTVTASTLQPEEETTILVVDKGATISDAFANTLKIKHIDQVTASDKGVATFKFMYADNAGLDVYVGYATMAADADPVEDVVDEVTTGGDPVDPGPVDPDPEDPKLPADFMYGDVNHDVTINVSDASAVISYILSEVPFKDASGNVYEYGIKAANVDASVNEENAPTINVSDVSLIISWILNPSIEFPAAGK